MNTTLDDQARAFTIQDKSGALDVDVFFDAEGAVLSQLNVTGVDEDTVSLTWPQISGFIELISLLTE